jgi:hypothetical protein
VRTEKPESSGTTYGSEYQLSDGLLRPRQIQTEGPDGGRLIADTLYDGSGRVVKTNDTYYTTGAYDVTGNRTGLTRHGVGSTPTSTATATYTYTYGLSLKE